MNFTTRFDTVEPIDYKMQLQMTHPRGTENVVKHMIFYAAGSIATITP